MRAGATDHGLAERLAGVVGDSNTLERRVGADLLCDRLGEMLARAQDADAVRHDVTLPDVEALMVACMTRHPDPDPLIAVIESGLRPDPRRPVVER